MLVKLLVIFRDDIPSQSLDWCKPNTWLIKTKLNTNTTQNSKQMCKKATNVCSNRNYSLVQSVSREMVRVYSTAPRPHNHAVYTRYIALKQVNTLQPVRQQYDTIEEFNVDSKAKESAESSTRSQKLKQSSAPLMQYRLRSVKAVRKE